MALDPVNSVLPQTIAMHPRPDASQQSSNTVDHGHSLLAFTMPTINLPTRPQP